MPASHPVPPGLPHNWSGSFSNPCIILSDFVCPWSCSFSSSPLADRSWEALEFLLRAQWVTDGSWSHSRKEPERGQLPGDRSVSPLKGRSHPTFSCAPRLPSLLCLDLIVGRADASRVTIGLICPAAAAFGNSTLGRKHPSQLLLETDGEAGKIKPIGVIYILHIVTSLFNFYNKS